MLTAAPIVPIFSTGDYDGQIRRAAELLRAGGLVLLPTETVYGAAGLLAHPGARQRRPDPNAGPTKFAKPSTIVRVGAESYQVVRQGVYDERIIEKMLRTTVLFVCSGNTCRSPMSEAIARRLLAEKLGVAEADLEKKGIVVMSAGASAMHGARATPQAVEAVKGLGADLSRHRSQPLSVELIHRA